MCKWDNDECCLVKGAGEHIIICFSGWSQLCGSLHLHRTLKYFCVQVIESFLMDLKVAASVVIVFANFLSIMQLTIPSLISTSPHKCGASISRHSSKQEDPALCSQQTGPPRYGVLCPDWIKCAGIPEIWLFSFTALAEEGET